MAIPVHHRKLIIVAQADAECVKKGILPAMTLIVPSLLYRTQRECTSLEKVEKKAKKLCLNLTSVRKKYHRNFNFVR